MSATRRLLLELVVEGIKRIEGAQVTVQIGIPFSNVTVISVSLVITNEELSTPAMITTTSFPLVGNLSPVIASSVPLETEIDKTVGETLFNY